MQKQVKERPKKRKKQEKKLEFEAGKVFTPGEVKEEDFELDLDSARFKAQKGEGGDRRAGHFRPPPASPFLCGCLFFNLPFFPPPTSSVSSLVEGLLPSAEFNTTNIIFCSVF